MNSLIKEDNLPCERRSAARAGVLGRGCNVLALLSIILSSRHLRFIWLVKVVRITPKIWFAPTDQSVMVLLRTQLWPQLNFTKLLRLSCPGRCSQSPLNNVSGHGRLQLFLNISQDSSECEWQSSYSNQLKE